jgi:hypothetical protein
LHVILNFVYPPKTENTTYIETQKERETIHNQQTHKRGERKREREREGKKITNAIVHSVFDLLFHCQAMQKHSLPKNI